MEAVDIPTECYWLMTKMFVCHCLPKQIIRWIWKTLVNEQLWCIDVTWIGHLAREHFVTCSSYMVTFRQLEWIEYGCRKITLMVNQYWLSVRDGTHTTVSTNAVVFPVRTVFGKVHHCQWSLPLSMEMTNGFLWRKCCSATLWYQSQRCVWKSGNLPNINFRFFYFSSLSSSSLFVQKWNNYQPWKENKPVFKKWTDR